MTDLKFRAWDKNNRQMSASFSVWELWNHEDAHLADFGSPILMQFTGLKDKNGKEVYFGDIVKAIARPGGDNDPAYDAIRGYGEQTLFCECDGHSLRIRFTQKQNGLFEFEPNELEGIEVIGNIYENSLEPS